MRGKEGEGGRLEGHRLLAGVHTHIISGSVREVLGERSLLEEQESDSADPFLIQYRCLSV